MHRHRFTHTQRERERENKKLLKKKKRKEKLIGRESKKRVKSNIICYNLATMPS